jgi:hypothetical protein
MMTRFRYGLIGLFLCTTAVSLSLSLGKCLPLAGPWTLLGDGPFDHFAPSSPRRVRAATAYSGFAST